MISSPNTADLYMDFNGLAELRHKAQKQDSESILETAQQFEALFLQTMLKSMRDSVQKSGLFNSSEQNLYSDLFDKQLALSISNSGGLGIADVLYSQLSTLQPVEKPWSNKDQFLTHMKPIADKYAEELQIPSEAILSVAALETGWGRKIIELPNGSSSFNLFGIKADPAWQGQRVASPTLEFIDGAMQKQKEVFRAYSSAEESVKDFISFLKSNSRYSQTISADSTRDFFKGLQQAGYATDPKYADKLSAVAGSNSMKQVFKNI